MTHVLVEANVLAQRRRPDIQTVQGGVVVVVVCGVWCTLRVVSMCTFPASWVTCTQCGRPTRRNQSGKTVHNGGNINCVVASEEAKCPPRLAVHRELKRRSQLDPASIIPSLRELTYSNSTFHRLSSRHKASCGQLLAPRRGTVLRASCNVHGRGKRLQRPLHH